MSAKHDQILLHVGFIKTATTFLQNQVFAGPEEGLELAAGKQTRAHLVQEIILANDFDFHADRVRDRLEQLAAPVRRRGNLPIWSEEMLLGNPPSRRYDGFGNAQKLHAVYPDAKVLITIRRQAAIVLSMYREYVLGGGTLPLRAFVGRGDEALSFSPVLRSSFLEFDAPIRHYTGLFGAGNVLILPQELLTSDPQSYFESLSSFTGRSIAHDVPRAREHVGEGAQALQIRRVTNRFVQNDPTRSGRHGLAWFFDRAIGRIDRVVPARMNNIVQKGLSSEIDARFSGMFRHSNRRTADMTGLPLKALGYDM